MPAGRRYPQRERAPVDYSGSAAENLRFKAPRKERSKKQSRCENLPANLPAAPGTILRALLHDSEGGELTADPDDPEIEDHAQVAVAAIDSIGSYRCETDNRAIQVSRPNE